MATQAVFTIPPHVLEAHPRHQDRKALFMKKTKAQRKKLKCLGLKSVEKLNGWVANAVTAQKNSRRVMEAAIAAWIDCDIEATLRTSFRDIVKAAAEMKAEVERRRMEEQIALMRQQKAAERKYRAELKKVKVLDSDDDDEVQAAAPAASSAAAPMADDLQDGDDGWDGAGDGAVDGSDAWAGTEDGTGDEEELMNALTLSDAADKDLKEFTQTTPKAATPKPTEEVGRKRRRVETGNSDYRKDVPAAAAASSATVVFEPGSGAHFDGPVNGRPSAAAAALSSSGHVFIPGGSAPAKGRPAAAAAATPAAAASYPSVTGGVLSTIPATPRQSDPVRRLLAEADAVHAAAEKADAQYAAAGVSGLPGFDGIC